MAERDGQLHCVITPRGCHRNDVNFSHRGDAYGVSGVKGRGEYRCDSLTKVLPTAHKASSTDGQGDCGNSGQAQDQLTLRRVD